MSSRFRIHCSRNLNLLLFFILFHLQILGDPLTINFFHMFVLINYRSNVLACNNRLIIATFNEIERHSSRYYFNRSLGTRLIIGTKNGKHKIMQTT